MRRTCGYKSEKQATKGNPVFHEADDWEHVIRGRALRRPEHSGAPSNHIGKQDRVQCGELEGASPAEMQEDLDDVFLGHVRIRDEEVPYLRGDLIPRDGLAQLSQRQGGICDVDDTSQETHRVEGGQGWGALLRGLLPAVHGLDGRNAPHRAFESSAFGEDEDPLRRKTGNVVEGDADVAVGDGHDWVLGRDDVERTDGCGVGAQAE